MESFPHILDVAGGGGDSVRERWSRQLAELSRVSDELLPGPACDFSNAKHSWIHVKPFGDRNVGSGLFL